MEWGKPSLYKPTQFPFTGEGFGVETFVAIGEKGDCVVLHEEGTGVYTRFTPSSGFGSTGSSLIVSLGSSSLLDYCRQGIIVSLPCILPLC